MTHAGPQTLPRVHEASLRDYRRHHLRLLTAQDVLQLNRKVVHISQRNPTDTQNYAGTSDAYDAHALLCGSALNRKTRLLWILVIVIV